MTCYPNLFDAHSVHLAEQRNKMRKQRDVRPNSNSLFDLVCYLVKCSKHGSSKCTDKGIDTHHHF